MISAGLIIFVVEMYWVWKLHQKYGVLFSDGIEMFISRASAEDTWSCIQHMSSFGMMIATMGRLFNV